MFELSTPKEITYELGQRLRTQRLAQNMSQLELALRTGLSESMVAKFEKTGTASLENFIKLIYALGHVWQLNELLEYRPLSIAQMEQFSLKRKRARTRKLKP